MNSIKMLHEKSGKRGMRNRGRYQSGSKLIEQTLVLLGLSFKFQRLQLHGAIYRPDSFVSKLRFVRI